MFGAEAFPKMTTGTDLVPVTSGSLATTGGSAVQSMSPMDSIREMFIDMRDALERIAENTLETNELLRTAVLGTPAEQRAEAIASGETDPVPETDQDSPTFLQRLQNVNPFSGGLGTFGKLALAVAGLLGIKLFEDDLEGGIAGLLEAIKNSKLGEKVNELTTKIKEDASEAFESLRNGITRTIEATKLLVEKIKSIYTVVETYVNKFDTDDVEGLSETEMKALTDDLTDKFSTFAIDVLSGIFKGVISTILATTLVSTAVSSISATVRAGVLGGGIGPNLPGVMQFSALTKFGKVSLVAAIGLGVLELINTSKSAYEEAITDAAGDKQNFDVSEFVGAFFGGEGKGIFNSFEEFLSKASIGLAAGAGLGFTFAKLGFTFGTPFGPIGMVTGALAGALIGGVVGAVGGYFGGERISNMLDNFGNMVNDAATAIVDYFGGLVSSVKNYFGIGIEGMDTAEELGTGLTNVNKQIEEQLEMSMSVPANARRLEKLLNDRSKILQKIDDLTLGDDTATNVSDIQQQINLRQNDLTKFSETLKGKEYSRNESVATRQKEADKIILDSIVNDIERLEKQKNMLLNPDLTSNLIGNVPVENRFADLQGEIALAQNKANAPGGIVTKIDNSSTAIKGGDNITVTGLSAEQNYFTALELANKKARMV